jgi:hypothetical protein
MVILTNFRGETEVVRLKLLGRGGGRSHHGTERNEGGGIRDSHGDEYKHGSLLGR